MKKGTRRADVKGRLTPRRLSWFGWVFARAFHYSKILLAVAALVALVVWVGAEGYFVKAMDWSGQKIAQSAVHVGFAVDDVVIEGRNRIDIATLKTAIGVDVGDPILGVDIEAVHARLMGISWVKDIQIRRVLPSTLVVMITERMPAALWLDAVGGPVVIDREGVVLTHENIQSFGVMLAVEGQACEKFAGALIDLLQGQPDIAVRVVKAIRVSERRWDLVFENGLKIKLPEDDPGYALARAARAQLQEKIFEQTLRAIDLRQADRIILEGKPGEQRDLLLKGENPV